MALTNTSFETGSATPAPPSGSGYLATGWTSTYVSTGSAFANFGDATVTEAAERFERNWSSNESYSVSIEPSAVATFNPAGPYASTAEGFEVLWVSNESFSFDLGRLELLNFSSTLLPAETFEIEWSTNELYKFAFDVSDLTDAPSGPDNFEAHWRFNESFVTTITASAQAQFDGTSPQLAENFEEVDLHLWIVYLPLVIPSGEFKITVNNRDAVFNATGGESPTDVRDQLISQVNNLGDYYVARPANTRALYLMIDERIVSDPILDLAELLDGGGAIQVAGPTTAGVPLVVLQRVDAKTLWTQAGKLFSL